MLVLESVSSCFLTCPVQELRGSVTRSHQGGGDGLDWPPLFPASSPLLTPILLPLAPIMAIGSILALLGAIVAALSYYVQDPANFAKFKGLIEPVLIASNIGYHGHRVGEIFKHIDLPKGKDFGTDGCEVKLGW